MATTPWVAGLYADLFGYKTAEARATSQQSEDEQTRTPLVTSAPRMEWDEPLRWQLGRDARFSLATLEQDIGLRPIIPARAWDETEWQKWTASRVQQDDEPWHTFFLVPQPPPTRGWDDWDWSRDFSTLCAKPHITEQDLPSLPPPPLTGWFDESAAAYAGSYGSLAAMVVMDEFVNAPAGGGFGPAPRGRSARFGFSISSFR